MYMRTSSLYQLPQRFVQVKQHETLGAYFLLLPLRDEAAVSIGTDTIPTLFNVSFILTLVATPLATAFLSRASVSRATAVKQLFSIFACSLAVFFILYHAASAQSPASNTVQLESSKQSHRHLLEVYRPQEHVLRTTSSTTNTSLGGRMAGNAVHERKIVISHRPSRHMLDAPAAATAGPSELTKLARAVRIAFYLWLSLVNLLATSTLWARAADAFDSNAAMRLFGFLGAGATIGQLIGSLSAAIWAHLKALAPDSNGPPLAQLLIAAALFEAAG